jgi:hypothetical protein
MGCRQRVSSGLDWVFEQVEEAIILEDDCLPHPSFFPYCDSLLDHYRQDERVGHIGGTDNNPGEPRGQASYYFSRYTSIWGWATWRRAWASYQVNIPSWPGVRSAGDHKDLFGTPEEADHCEQVWDDIHSGALDTWDAQWLYCRLCAGSISIAPNGNLITNIGFRFDATHTVMESHPFAELPTREMTFPLAHPADITPDTEADRARAEAEFLRKLDGGSALMGKLGNKHFYGKFLRAIPGIGKLWAGLRSRSGAQAGE